jgi:hypothetical protein
VTDRVGSLGRDWRTNMTEIVPRSLRKLFQGPLQRVAVDHTGATTVVPASWFRPAAVEVPPALIMRKHLSLPLSAKADLASSIQIMVLSETPFEPHEVLVDAVRRPVGAETDTLTYDINLLPKSYIESGLRQMGVPHWRVLSIRSRNIEGTTSNRPDFAAAFGPGRRLFRAAAILSVCAMLGSTIVACNLHLSSVRAVNQAMADLVSRQQEVLRGLDSDLQAGEDAIAGKLALNDAFAPIPSTFLFLERLRQALPSGTAIQRIDISMPGARVNVKYTDILGLVRALEQDAWSVRIEGPIARNGNDATETALLAFEVGP